MITSFKELWSNANYRIASIIAIIMLLWLASGIFASESPPDPVAAKPEAGAKKASVPVRARTIEAQLYPLVVSLKGKTEANRKVDVRAEVGGAVESLPVAKGSVVKAGDVICQLAVEDRALRVAEAEAAAAQAQIEYDGALRLKTGGYQSETAIANAKARLQTTKANLLRQQLDLEKTAVRAPFDGVVDERPVELGALMRAGDTCATILDLNPLLVTAEVSEQEFVNVPSGGEVSARLITGQQVLGNIRYISRSSDDVTRTFRIEAEVDNPDQNLVAGLTAEIQVLTAEAPAHLVPSALLVLGDEGELGLRVLDGENIVRQIDVNLVGDHKEGVWVTGLPRSTRLITVGHEYVGVGEVVEVAMEGIVNDSPLTSDTTFVSEELNQPLTDNVINQTSANESEATGDSDTAPSESNNNAGQTP